MSLSSQAPQTTRPAAERGVTGGVVVVGVLSAAFVTVAVALAVIQPPAGAKPAPDHKRPFGPATQTDQGRHNKPLLYRNLPDDLLTPPPAAPAP